MSSKLTNDKVLSIFKEAVRVEYPGAIFQEEKIKYWTKNRKILMKRKERKDNDFIVNLSSAFISRISKKRFEPVLIFGNKGKVALLGARLTKHGGHLAVEAGRKFASKRRLKLVILDRMVICFVILKIPGMKPDISVENNTETELKNEIASKIKILEEINEDFLHFFKKAVQ